MIKKIFILVSFLTVALSCSGGGVGVEAQDSVSNFIVPEDTSIKTHLADYLSSGESEVGDRFAMTVFEVVKVDGTTVIPAGAIVHGRVTEVESAGRPQKGGRLKLAADSLEVSGRKIPIEARITAPGRKLEGKGSLKEDWKEILIGSGVGAAVGALIEGDEGALAGVLIGGAGTFMGTKGEQVELVPETPLMVVLNSSVVVPVKN